MKRFQQVIEQIPPHLKKYIVDQDYSRYTPVDQATWRFILRQLKHFLTQHAHPCYVDGLTKTGIQVESIPRIEEMAEKLQQFGWTAIPVSGFIPPAAFMELQSLSILPIACDMRSVDHILYTPAPDIVHEAAGHAPILIDPEFASYLKQYAQVAKKAIISSEDLALYEAIRDLSDIKENPSSSPQDIADAEKHLAKVSTSLSHVSEASLLSRMNWWTAEYGLIGSLQQPKIFGAGLLSSIGESRHCLQKKVKKIALSVDCIQTSYDITEEQPQLFVAQNFSNLSSVLADLESQLSYKRGGLHGLQVALRAKTVNTVQFDSGLQISGIISEIMTDNNKNVIYCKFQDACQLSEAGRELPGHGVTYHAQGYSTPLGPYKSTDLHLQKRGRLEFDSGVVVEGLLIKTTLSSSQTPFLLTFKDCSVTYKETTLFKPEWGLFDMALAREVVSVFAGPADRSRFGMTDDFVKKVIPRKEYSTQEKIKNSLYQKVRDLRQRGPPPQEELLLLFNELQNQFPEEWLLWVELLELSQKTPLAKDIENILFDLQRRKPERQEYIDLGLQLAGTLHI